MLSLNNIIYHIAGRTILEDANLQLDAGHKAALIGRNGTGKSTLFNLILGNIQVDGGDINIAKNLKIVTVKQEMPSGEESLLEFVMNSDNETRNLFDELNTCEDPNRLGDIYDRLIQIDAYSAEARASVILLGLGFSDEKQKRSLNSFSGGFRMRVALASALFQRPDLLLLDEPTNHLDLESILWLTDYLKNYPGSLIIISHEREFLNKIVGHVFHLSQGKLTYYKGNYDIYEEKYKQKLENDIAFNKKVEAQKAHMQKFVDRFQYKASKAKQAQSRIKAISKLNPIALLADDPSIKLYFPESEKLPSPIISFDKLNLGYNDNVILHRVSGNIANDDRIALLGANGNGKSTFAKVLARTLKPMAGSFNMLDKINIGYFNQHQYETLDSNRNAIEHLKDINPKDNDLQIRSHLGRFGLERDKATNVISKLSGGEKARLVFAMITLMKPHLLILDEPTNHLDMDMIESLIFALNEYNGAIILISHNMHLIEHTVDKLWVVENQTITEFKDSIYEYKKYIMKK